MGSSNAESAELEPFKVGLKNLLREGDEHQSAKKAEGLIRVADEIVTKLACVGVKVRKVK